MMNNSQREKGQKGPGLFCPIIRDFAKFAGKDKKDPVPFVPLAR